MVHYCAVDMNAPPQSDDHESIKREQCVSSQLQEYLGGVVDMQLDTSGVYESTLPISAVQYDDVRCNPPLRSSMLEESPRRFPCKARNVCDSHTADAAYIELPANAPHGLTLFCSHPKCCETGRAFRWCGVCQLIVAKRNFMMRHSHGLLRSRRSHATMLENEPPSENRKIDETRLIPNATKYIDETEGRSLHGGLPFETLSAAAGRMESILSRSEFDSESLIVNFPDNTVVEEDQCASRWHRPKNEQVLKSGLGHLSSATGVSLVGQSQLHVSDDDDGMSIETIGSLNGLSEADIDDIFD